MRLEAIAAAQGFERIGLIDDAVEAFLATEDDKKHFLQLASRVARLFKAILPDPLGQRPGAAGGAGVLPRREDPRRDATRPTSPR